MAEIIEKNDKYNETVEEVLKLLHPNKLTSWDDAMKVDRDRKCLSGSLIEVLELAQKKQIEATKNNSNIDDIIILRESVNEIISKGLMDEIFTKRVSSEKKRYDEIFNHISHNLDELDELKDKIMAGIELEPDYNAIISNSDRDNYLTNVQKVALDISLKKHGLEGFIGTNIDIRNISDESIGLSNNIEINKGKLDELIVNLKQEKVKNDHSIYAFYSGGYVTEDGALFCDTFPKDRKLYLTEEEIISKYGKDRTSDVVTKMLEELRNDITNHYKYDDSSISATSSISPKVFASYKTAEELGFIEPSATVNKEKKYEAELSDLLLVKMKEDGKETEMVISYKNAKQQLEAAGFPLTCTLNDLFVGKKLSISLIYPTDKKEVQHPSISNGNNNLENKASKDFRRTYVSDYEYIENGIHYHLPNWNTEPHVQLKLSDSAAKLYENDSEPHVRLK